MTPLSTRRALTAIFTFLALVLSACGGGSTTVISSPRVTAEGDAATQAPLPADAIEAEAPADEGVPEQAAPETDVAGETDSSAAGEDEFVLEFDFGDVVLDGEETDGITEGGVPVGANFLTQAAAATESSASYRYDVNFSMYLADGATVFDISPSEPVSTGEVVGTTSRMYSDLGPVFDEMFTSFGGSDAADMIGLLFGDDLSMEVISTDTTMYIRAPFLAGMATGPAASELGPDFAALGELAEGWGTVDLNSLGDSLGASDIAGISGAQTGSSPDQLLDMLREVSDDVTEVGRESVRGVETTHLRAVVSMASMLAAQGVTADDMGIDLAAFDVSLPFDVFIDDDGRVRRVEMTLSLAELAGLVPDEPLPAGTEFEFSTTIDLYDFESTIDIPLPAQGEIVGDFTQLFADLAALDV